MRHIIFGLLLSLSMVTEAIAWEASCETDEMTDSNNCKVKKTHYFNAGGEEQYIVVSANRNSVYVMPKTIYPHRAIQLRIDKNTMHESKKYTQGIVIFSGAKNIINEMKKGNSLKIRYSDWPNGYSRTANIPLGGFTAAYNKAFR